MNRFIGKNFVITGGSGGIGRAAARRLVSEGGRVLVTGTNAEKLAGVADGERLLTLVNDAGSPTSAEDLADAVAKHFGKIDGVFLNAGFGIFAPHNAVTADQYDQQYAVNVRGPILQAKTLSPLMIDGGNVLINTSVAQDLGMEGGVIYNSTKGALRTVTRVLAKELSPRGIRVNAVSPGPIGTEFFARTGIPEEQLSQMAAGIQSMVPLNRFGTPEEVAAVALFLMSDDASFVTGAEYAVDGGMTQV